MPLKNNEKTDVNNSDNENKNTKPLKDISWTIQKEGDPFGLYAKKKVEWITPKDQEEFKKKVWKTLLRWEKESKNDNLIKLNLYKTISNSKRRLIKKIQKEKNEENRKNGMISRTIFFLWVSGDSPTRSDNFVPEDFLENVRTFKKACGKEKLLIIFTDKTRKELDESNDPLLTFCRKNKVLLINFRDLLGKNYIFEDAVESSCVQQKMGNYVDYLRVIIALRLFFGTHYLDMDLRTQALPSNYTESEWENFVQKAWQQPLLLVPNCMLSNFTHNTSQANVTSQANDFLIFAPLLLYDEESFFSSQQGEYLLNLHKGMFWTLEQKNSPDISGRFPTSIPIEYKITDKNKFIAFGESFAPQKGTVGSKEMYDGYANANQLFQYLTILPKQIRDFFLTVSVTTGPGILPDQDHLYTIYKRTPYLEIGETLHNSCTGTWLAKSTNEKIQSDQKAVLLFQQTLTKILSQLQFNTLDLNYYEEVISVDSGIGGYLLHTLIFHCDTFKNIETIYMDKELQEFLKVEKRNEALEKMLIEHNLLDKKELEILGNDKSLLPLLKKSLNELLKNKKKFKNFNRAPQYLMFFPAEIVDIAPYIKIITGKELQKIAWRVLFDLMLFCPNKEIENEFARRLKKLNSEDIKQIESDLKEKFIEYTSIITSREIMLFFSYYKAEEYFPDNKQVQNINIDLSDPLCTNKISVLMECYFIAYLALLENKKFDHQKSENTSLSYYEENNAQYFQRYVKLLRSISQQLEKNPVKKQSNIVNNFFFFSKGNSSTQSTELIKFFMLNAAKKYPLQPCQSILQITHKYATKDIKELIASLLNQRTVNRFPIDTFSELSTKLNFNKKSEKENNNGSMKI